MKKILISIAILVGLLISVLFYRSFTVFENNQFQVIEPIPAINIDSQQAIQRFSQSIQIPTVSYDDASQINPQAFTDFHQFLANNFPLVHQKTQLTKFEDFSLLFHFEGSDTQLAPILFMGHMDVVPVDQASKNQWLHNPFGGEVIDGTIWGRGAIDDKVSVVALMEAMEHYLSAGKQPKRSIYFAFGHDEEVGGKGAVAIAKYFKQTNTRFEFVMDEGGIIADGLVPGISQQVALIGVAEKGFVNFRLTVKGEGGHSSQPPAHTAAGILAQAIVKVENNPFKAKVDFFELMFERIGYATDLSLRLPLANLWILEPIVMQVLTAKPSTAASSRTTTAVTMLQGSSKSNVLPTVASAVVNFRILPGDTINSIHAHLEKVIDDPQVTITAELANEASTVSPADSYGFNLIESTIRRIDQNILVAPYLMIGATDARHFHELSDNIYRFMMVTFNSDTLKQFHGINEQISVNDYLRSVQFYHAMLEQSASGVIPKSQ
ncbi:M20 family peptidase [Paraglaciecola aquimarina]|uniref:M20 family peptidase n=1 Tax=Paraglaciecola algarum TaxID=3050085 RepID=A0ABS9D2X9_9ALTE|nr:M20 family peptidase [Paraglaciecola sp. G1-23]MCF2947241.1 M20 family peptidase [Paraglaciecola sp. G1-23]